MPKRKLNEPGGSFDQLGGNILLSMLGGCLLWAVIIMVAAGVVYIIFFN